MTGPLTLQQVEAEMVERSGPEGAVQTKTQAQAILPSPARVHWRGDIRVWATVAGYVWLLSLALLGRLAGPISPLDALQLITSLTLAVGGWMALEYLPRNVSVGGES